MRIDIWSDVVCPWCYLGKRRLERALGELAWSDEVTVRWRAFLLDPRATDEPGDLRAALERKYGPGAFHAMTERLTRLGAAEGIDYRFADVVRVSSRHAHRLLAWAGDDHGAGAQDRLQERLFRAYFTEGANIAERDTLVRLAADAGLYPDEAAGVLHGDGHADTVVADLRAAHERQLTGVPAFVLEDALVIPGAQEVHTFVSVLGRARERLGGPVG